MKTDIINKLKHPLPLSILAGILNGTSYIPFPPWALFFCLTPLFYIWLTETPKKVFLYTSLTYFIGILLGFFWINHLLMEFAFFPIYLSIPVLFLFSFFLNLHIAIAGFLWAKLLRPWTKIGSLGAAAFCALAFFLVPSVFPWHYGYAWLYGGLRGFQFADIIGFDGLNVLTILASGGFLWALISKENKALKVSLITFLVLLFNFSGFLYGKSKTLGSESVNVLITQANIGNLQKHYQVYGNRFKKEVTSQFLNLTQKGLDQHPDTDVVVWPETAFPEIYNERFFFKTSSGKRLQSFISGNEVNLISGFYVSTGDGRTANSALFINKAGEVAAKPIYKKILIAFGEYLPFEKQLPFLRKLLPMVGNFKKGTEAGVRELDGIRYGAQICYESLYPSHTRELSKNGAQIIVNLTNDSWYGRYSEPYQHMYLTAARAVESGLPLIRSTNTGITTVALPNGTLLEQSPLFEEGTFYYKVPYKKGEIKPTVYTTWGWAIPLPFMLLMVILSIAFGKTDGNVKPRLETDS